MILPPFFLGPSVAAILDHIDAIAQAVRVPVIVQYASLQTGRFIAAEAFANLHRARPDFSHVEVDLVSSGSTIIALWQNSNGSLRSLVGYVGLHLPEGWTASSQVGNPEVAAGHDGKTAFSVTIPDDWNRAKSRVAIAADIMADGQYLG